MGGVRFAWKFPPRVWAFRLKVSVEKKGNITAGISSGTRQCWLFPLGTIASLEEAIMNLITRNIFLLIKYEVICSKWDSWE